MTIGFLFWLLMILWLFFGIWSFRSSVAAQWPFVSGLGFIWVLFLLVGIQIFGWPIKT